MKKISMIMAVVCASAVMYSCGSSNNAPKDSVEAAKESNDKKEDDKVLAVTEDDSKFLVFAADAGMMEVQSGELAKTKNVNQGIKDFAAMMVKDHTAAGEEVKTLAGNKKVTLPAGISEDHQKALADLGKKSDADFSKAYVDMMVDDHQKVVDKFKDAADKCKDADIKAFAVKTLPTLQGHLDHAKRLKDATK